jgi:DNA-binding transcriptional LysR family regulator
MKPDSDSRLNARPWRGLQLRHLAALVALAREPSLPVAARSICPRSVLRGRVSGLERTVGARLLTHEHDAPQACLTDAGRLMLAHAEAVMARLQAARADLAAQVENPRLRDGA